MKSLLSVLSGVLFLIGYLPYIRAILKGDTRPSKASWIIWAVLDTITFAGMASADSLNGNIVGAVIGVWIVAVLSMRYGKSGWSGLDKFCLFGAASGLIIWQVFQNPVLGIVLSQFVVLIGSIPTFVSAWKNPQQENKLAWTLFWVSCVLAVIVIPHWTLEDAVQPIVFLMIETTMMALLYIKPKRWFESKPI